MALRRHLLVVLFVLASTLPAFAQSHPCDQPAATSAKVATTTVVKAEFCSPQSDFVDAVTVYTGTTATNLSTLEQVTPTPNSAGLVQYRITLGTYAAGTYEVQVSAWNKSGVNGAAQEGPKSSPFALTVVTPNPAPVAPKIVRVGS